MEHEEFALVITRTAHVLLSREVFKLELFLGGFARASCVKP